MIFLLPGTRGGGGHQLYYEVGVCGWGVGDLLRTFKVLCPVPCAECGSLFPVTSGKRRALISVQSAPFLVHFFFLPHLLPKSCTMNATTVAVAPESGMQQLNYIETLWESMYEGRNPLIVTGVFAFLMHEIVYFGRFIPFLICDFIPYFQRYKLQPVSRPCGYEHVHIYGILTFL